MDAEEAHHFTFRWLRRLFKIPGFAGFFEFAYRSVYYNVSDKSLPLGVRNRLGLAAGFDKDGVLLKPLKSCGFGFVEVGTVTPVAQSGNPKPRLFRLIQDKAIINRMGFNNAGVHQLAKQLEAFAPHKGHLIIGGNIGKNKDTPNERAVEDYLKAMEVLQPWVDYFVVNVSSPNTPGLRALQEREPLTNLLQSLLAFQQKQPKPKPILLKIAPDLTDTQLAEIAEIVNELKLAGVVATNTTIAREGLSTTDDALQAIGNGGLSGVPLQKRATEVIQILRQQLAEGTLIIGVGGVDSPEAALEKLNAGADLIQIYTGFIYQGPVIVQKIKKSILNFKP